jgi:hypothetical protein
MNTTTTKPLLKWSDITPEEMVIMEKQMVRLIEEGPLWVDYVDDIDIIRDTPKILDSITDFYMDFLEEELGWRENNDWRYGSTHDDLDEFRKSLYVFVGTVHLKHIDSKGLLDEYNKYNMWVSR